MTIFSHRGFCPNDKSKQNSIEAFVASRDAGFKAIELDLWLVEDELILKHDQPQKNELNHLTRFDEVLKFKEKLLYWLDFKNLNESNALKILALVKLMIEQENIPMTKFFFAPFITNYSLVEKILPIFRNIICKDIQFLAVCENFDFSSKLDFVDFIKRNHIKNISIFHELIDIELINMLPEVDFFAWTVNEQDRLDFLMNWGVKNFASDQRLIG